MNKNKPSTVNNVLQWISDLWVRLVFPSKAYQNQVLNAKARLLSVFLLMMFLFYLGVDLFSTNNAKVPFLYFFGYALMIATFFINRNVNFLFASRMASLLVPYLIFASVFSRSSEYPLLMLYYLVLGMILTSFIIRKLGVILIGSINTIGILLLHFLNVYPDWSFQEIANPLVINLSVTSMIVAYMSFRDSVEQHNQISVPRSEVNFNTIINNSPLGIVISEGRSVINIANPAICNLLGYSEDEILGRKVFDFIHPDDRDRANKDFMAFLTSTNNTFEMEVRYQKKNGESLWVNVNSSMVFDDSGLPVYGIAIIEDISERKVTEKLILDKQNELEEAQRIASMGSWMNNYADNSIIWSDEIYRIFGYPPDTDLSPREIFNKHLSPEDKADERKKMSILMNDPDSKTFEDIQIRIDTKQGDRKHLASSGEFIFDTSGKKVAVKGTLLDITKIITAEKELQESIKRFEIIFKNSPLGITVVSPTTQILQANNAFCEMLGYTQTEILDQNMVELTYAEDIEEVADLMGKVLAEETDQFELAQRLVKKDGTAVWINYTGALMRDERGDISFGIGIVENITDKREAELTLQESVEKFRGFMDQSLDGILLADQNGIIQEWSQGMETNTGICANDAVGHFVWDIQDQLLPDDLRSLINTTKLKTQYFDFIENSSSKENYQIDETTVKHTNGELRSIQIASFPIQTDKGVLIGSIHRDISDQQAAQQALQDLTQELDRSNKELEQFAYIASHDLQEPLRKIQTFGERLNANYLSKLDERGADYVERMQDAASRGQKMVEALLLYSRVTTQGQPFAETNLTDVLNNVLEDLELQIEEQGAQVNVDRLPVIEADPTQMQQLFQNLISNALKFHQEGQPPIISVQIQPTGKDQVEISVADQGIGFDESYSDQIFQPFQRLHGRSEYEGSGIGLSVCKKIVERHNGRIRVQSQPGEGTTFFISLPINGLPTK